MTLLAVTVASGAIVVAVLALAHWWTIRRELERIKVAERAAVTPQQPDDPYGFNDQLNIIRNGRFGSFRLPPGSSGDVGNN